MKRSRRLVEVLCFSTLPVALITLRSEPRHRDKAALLLCRKPYHYSQHQQPEEDGYGRKFVLMDGCWRYYKFAWRYTVKVNNGCGESRKTHD